MRHRDFTRLETDTKESFLQEAAQKHTLEARATPGHPLGGMVRATTSITPPTELGIPLSVPGVHTDVQGAAARPPRGATVVKDM